MKNTCGGLLLQLQWTYVWLKIEIKNIIGASITASTWKNITKDISQNKENLQKGFWSVYKFRSVNYKSYSVKCVTYYLHHNKWYKTQKQSPRGVLLNRCSANLQQIYSRAPMQKRYATFFEITFPYGSSPINLLHTCRHTFEEKLRGPAS